MMYPKLNIIPILFVTLVALSSCATTSNSAFGQAEDDVYFSKKESHKKAVYVPEVDVKEIIKQNPPQYGNPDQDRQYNDNGSSNFNYDEYKARQNSQSSTGQYEPEQQEQFLSTVPYAGQEEEAAEASRLRQQYYGNYNTYNTYNSSPYNNDPYYNGYGYNNYGYNSWGYPSTTIGLGWNSWGGMGLGLGFGWSTGWGYSWPHYNPYWGGVYGCNNWGYNNWCSPYYGNGWNNWYGNGYYGNNWGYNGYSERATPRAQRPRQSAGSNMPRGENYQPRANGVQTQTPANADQQQRNMPRSSNQGQLINRNGQQIYVAPEQDRTMPRSYGSYNRSVNDAERQRQATPPAAQPQQPRSVPRTYNREQQPAQYNGNQNTQPAPSQPQQRSMPRANTPAPQQQQAPQPRNYSPAPSAPQPSAPSGGGGGNRGGGGGGSRSGSMPRR
ncbi:MAG: hypothetical protein V4658_14525 [Bacteroidota bacterium]